MGELDQWLEGIGLGQYAEILAREHVDLALLPALTDHDLRALGLPLGHRRIMLDAIERLSRGGPTVSPDWQAGAPAGDAERRQLTVMFCDLVNSSALARQLDPEDLRDVIGAYRHSCTLPVQRFGGFVQRFVGDGVLAFFGYPTALEDEAERAYVRASASSRKWAGLPPRCGVSMRSTSKSELALQRGPWWSETSWAKA
jgi:class 3 adenylate cyclase